MRFVFGIIKLYFSLGVLFALILFTSIIYQYYQVATTTRTVGDIVGRALLDAVFRFFLWGPDLWQKVVRGGQPFIDWLLGTGTIV